MQDASHETILVIALIIFAVIIALYLAYAIPLTIAMWRLYGKAGKPGWTSLIPVYNTVVMARIAKRPEWMGWTVGIASIVSGIFSDAIRVLYYDPPYPRTIIDLPSGIADIYQSSTMAIVSAGVNVLAGLTALVLFIIILVSFIRQYRREDNTSTTGFWVCYFLLPIAAVFMMKNLSYKGLSLAASAPTTPPGQQPTPPLRTAGIIITPLRNFLSIYPHISP